MVRWQLTGKRLGARASRQLPGSYPAAAPQLLLSWRPWNLRRRRGRRRRSVRWWTRIAGWATAGRPSPSASLAAQTTPSRTTGEGGGEGCGCGQGVGVEGAGVG